MKTVEISEELQSLLESAEASDQDTVVLTDHERPVAALVSLKNVDPESLALSTSAEFLKNHQSSAGRNSSRGVDHAR